MRPWLYSSKNCDSSIDSTVNIIGVGAQSTLGGNEIFARKICIKNQQNSRILHDSCPKNYQNIRIFMTYARKIYKIPEFYMIFARKMPEFYIIIARRMFFPNFRGTLQNVVLRFLI